VKSVFTLVIKGLKRTKVKPGEEKLSIENLDIEIFHTECYGGKAIFRRTISKYSVSGETEEVWRLHCLRCGQTKEVRIASKERILIIATAIDGKRRKIGRSLQVVHQKQHGKRCPVCAGTGWVLSEK